MSSPERTATTNTCARASSTLGARVAIVVTVGLSVGALTSVLQTYLDSPWLSLVNAASPWLTFAFVLGARWRRPLDAAAAGIATGLLELIGYYVTANLRGHPAGGSVVMFWAACAIVGGPVFGVAGWAWWRAPDRLSNLGAAVLPAAYFAEAAVSYGLRLHYASSAILFAALGVMAFAVLGIHRRAHMEIARWLVVTIPVGMLAELILGLLYQQSF